MSMFKYQLPEKERIELYLNILEKEHKDKGNGGSQKTSSKSIASSQGIGLKDIDRNMIDSCENQLPAIDLKIKQKYSEKWEGQLGSFEKMAG